MRVTFDGKRAPGVTPKDMILHLIGQIGAAGGTAMPSNMPAARSAT